MGLPSLWEVAGVCAPGLTGVGWNGRSGREAQEKLQREEVGSGCVVKGNQDRLAVLEATVAWADGMGSGLDRLRFEPGFAT